jgi:hypothetical protein
MPKDKKNIKVRDLKPKKDAKGGGVGVQGVGVQGTGLQGVGVQGKGVQGKGVQHHHHTQN